MAITLQSAIHANDRTAVAGHESLPVVSAVVGNADRVDGALAERDDTLAAQGRAGLVEKMQPVIVGPARDQAVSSDRESTAFIRMRPVSGSTVRSIRTHERDNRPSRTRPSSLTATMSPSISAATSFKQALPPVPPTSRRHLPVLRIPFEHGSVERARQDGRSRRATS